jgi:ribosomal protein L20A (L18A)
MKRFNWRDLTEIVGFLSIVGSLIFVGMQLNQSQEIAIAAQYQERASTAVEYYSSLMHDHQTVNDKAAEIVAAADSGSASPALRAFVENRSPESIGIWFYRNRVFFMMLDNFHFQYISGFMAEESWDAFQRELRDELSNDATAAYYRDYGSNFRASFEDLCDMILEEVTSEGD